MAAFYKSFSRSISLGKALWMYAISSCTDLHVAFLAIEACRQAVSTFVLKRVWGEIVRMKQIRLCRAESVMKIIEGVKSAAERW